MLLTVSKSDVKKIFGDSVKKIRHQLGLSQEALAERADLHRTYVSDIERGSRNLSLENIERLARALEVNVCALFATPELKHKGKSTRHVWSDTGVDILFAEDDADDVELAMRALKRANIANRIHIVRDGAAVLDFLLCTGEYKHREQLDLPKLLLLDLGLPKVDGLEVLRQVKSDPRFNAIPVIIFTASKRARDFELAQKLGADGYIVKPMDFQNFGKAATALNFQWALLEPPTSAAS